MKKKCRYLSLGAEGTIYKISKNKVKKIWHKNVFGKLSVLEISNRFKCNKETFDLLPDDIKPYVKIPHCFGIFPYKKKVISIHEYIPGDNIFNGYLVEIDKAFNVSFILSKFFRDTQFPVEGDSKCDYTNIRPWKGKFYLVDVVSKDYEDE